MSADPTKKPFWRSPEYQRAARARRKAAGTLPTGSEIRLCAECGEMRLHQKSRPRCYACEVKRRGPIDPKKAVEYVTAWKKRHPEMHKAIRDRMCENLTDGYVRAHLTKCFRGLRAEDIPDELVEAQRQLMKIKRAINEKP